MYKYYHVMTISDALQIVIKNEILKRLVINIFGF